MRLLVLLLALLLQPAPPPFTARWDAPGRATLRWEQQQRACLHRESVIGERVFIGCYEGSGRAVLTLGHVGPLSGDLRPTAGDVFVLSEGETVSRAQLQSVVYLPSFR